jgi:ArsR family transcriptional regulator, virulence genes transcriptional regulator
MNLENLQLKAGEAERLLKAMASRPRLMILCELLRGERTVTALHEAVGLSMSAMSQHLARLRADELVSTRRESQTIFYSLADAGATRLLETLYAIYCAPADASPEQCETPPRPAGARQITP